MGRGIGVIAFLVGMGCASGCSWIFVEPLQNQGRYGVGHCTTNRAAPVIDTIFTTTNVISALYVAGQDNVANKSSAVTLGIVVAGMWLSSAIYGYKHTAECEEAMEEGTYRPPPRPARRYRSPRTPPPPPYAPPPPPYAPPPPPAAAPPAAAVAPAPPLDGGAPPDATAQPAAPPPVSAPARPAVPARPQQSDEDEPRERRAR